MIHTKVLQTISNTANIDNAETKAIDVMSRQVRTHRSSAAFAISVSISMLMSGFISIIT